MKDFNELKELVRKKGFGTTYYGNINGDPVYLSKGVLTKFFGDDDIQSVINAVGKFQDGDYGTAAEHGKTPKSGHEYGRYEIGGLEAADGEDCAVWIHKAEDALIVYFRFER
ncbi:MAG: hypothetical protein ACI4D6_10875 [Chordicoccus sp.]